MTSLDDGEKIKEHTSHGLPQSHFYGILQKMWTNTSIIGNIISENDFRKVYSEISLTQYIQSLVSKASSNHKEFNFHEYNKPFIENLTSERLTVRVGYWSRRSSLYDLERAERKFEVEQDKIATFYESFRDELISELKSPNVLGLKDYLLKIESNFPKKYIGYLRKSKDINEIEGLGKYEGFKEFSEWFSHFLIKIQQDPEFETLFSLSISDTSSYINYSNRFRHDTLKLGEVINYVFFKSTQRHGDINDVMCSISNRLSQRGNPINKKNMDLAKSNIIIMLFVVSHISRVIRNKDRGWKRLCSMTFKQLRSFSIKNELSCKSLIESWQDDSSPNIESYDSYEDFPMKEGFKPLRSVSDFANYISTISRRFKFNSKYKASYFKKIGIFVYGEKTNTLYFNMMLSDLNKGDGRFTWYGMQEMVKIEAKLQGFTIDIYKNIYKSIYKTYLFGENYFKLFVGTNPKNKKLLKIRERIMGVYPELRRIQLICKKSFHLVEEALHNQVKLAEMDGNLSEKFSEQIIHDFAIAFSCEMDSTKDYEKTEYLTEGIILSILNSDRVKRTSILKHNVIVDYMSLVNNYANSIQSIKPITGPYKGAFSNYKMGLLIKRLSYNDFKTLIEKELDNISDKFLEAYGLDSNSILLDIDENGLNNIIKYSGGILPFITTMANGHEEYKTAKYTTNENNKDKIVLGIEIFKSLTNGNIKKYFQMMERVILIDPEYVRKQILIGIGTREKSGTANHPRKLFRTLSSRFNVLNFKDSDLFLNEIEGKEVELINIIKNHIPHLDTSSYLVAKFEDIKIPNYWFAGDLTVCCMSLGSEKHFQYMFEEGFGIINIYYKDRVIANSVVWMANDYKFLVLDNVEVAPNYKDIANKNNIVYQVISKLAIEYTEKSAINTPFVIMGAGYNDIEVEKHLGKVDINNRLIPDNVQEKKFYSDAKKAYILKGDINQINQFLK